MPPLYRMPLLLPTLFAAAWLTGCDSPTPQPAQQTEQTSNVYLETLQEAKAARDSAEEHNRQEQRIDALLGRQAVDPLSDD